MITPTTKAFDLEALIPLSLIRQHTKTDDIPAVGDDLLRVYRDAAIQAAQAYTGLTVTGQRVVTELVTPKRPAYGSAYFVHCVKTQFAEPYAFYYGADNHPPLRVDVEVGARRVMLPALHGVHMMWCCNPCGVNNSLKLMYSGGFSCVDDIPAAIVLGCLKYIAHVIENPGDLVYSNSPTGRPVDAAAIDRTANPAWASGAIDIWRASRVDAV